MSDARGVLPFKGRCGRVERLDHYFWETRKLRVYKTRNGLLGADIAPSSRLGWR